VKLVWQERESAALLEMLAAWPDRVSSEIAHVEVIRAARRASTGTVLRNRAREVIAAVNLLPMNQDVLELAASVSPSRLRSLDAVHLGSALALGVDLGAMVTYDSVLMSAAGDAGVEVLSPGIRQ